MAKVTQIRGALLEEAVLFLLSRVGYRIVHYPADSIDPSDIKDGHSGLELEGRGTWHQIDAIAEQYYTPAFMYPLRLLVEAKFYTHSPVGLNVVRNSVGVLKDISENCFSKHRFRGALSTVRFNYQSAVFGVSGFTKPAVEYAIAHQIFLIEYKNVPVIQPLVDAIRDFDEACLTTQGKNSISDVRKILREALNIGAYTADLHRFLTLRGVEVINQRVRRAVLNIRGSYFGMLQGRWPMHLLTPQPLPEDAFTSDVVKCRLFGERNWHWCFTPVDVDQNDPRWFELQFFLPVELAKIVGQNWGDSRMVANDKENYFSFITITGKIGDTWRSVRLELDQNWLRQYIERLAD